MTGTIDIHTHVVPSSFPAYRGIRKDVAWPSVVHQDCGHACVYTGEKPFRAITANSWNPRLRSEEMEASGIARQALSPMPELLSYWLQPDDAAILARHTNDEIAQMVSADRARFLGLGMVPLQSIDLAIRELHYIAENECLHGIELGTNINGKPIGHPDFAAFFAVVNELSLPVFVHALRPVGVERLVGGAMLEQVIAFPCETAFAAASFVTGGIMQAHPDLRIAFSHGGGAFGQVLPRLQFSWSMAPELQEKLTLSPNEVARKFFYDTLVYDEAALRYLIEKFGISQLMVGTDYPFLIMDREANQRIDRLGLSESEKRQILRGNALRFFGLGFPQTST
ncbi:amidohydrolase family protein [Phenylobacterium sp. J367]|uniref:amidohydrolase family protein n=1 Tax=Phenylobacterium sp. J367 TaxID=2898435 RepID=UPI0021511B44|nr:amidohydrolase family protein [Phenylobacterium sp. J367]MCR5880229.1 amidohydrolase [Phenylobacterium sp. J367]